MPELNPNSNEGCRSYDWESNEACAIPPTGVNGTGYVVVDAYSDTTDLSLVCYVATVNVEPLSNGVPTTAVSASRGYIKVYSLNLRRKNQYVDCRLDGPNGDADLVRRRFNLSFALCFGSPLTLLSIFVYRWSSLVRGRVCIAVQRTIVSRRSLHQRNSVLRIYLLVRPRRTSWFTHGAVSPI